MDPRDAEWDVFICHASEDKAFVRKLVAKLGDKGYRVWYDEFELTVGDSLRRSIDRGLVRSRFGIVVLSPAFFAKEWPQRELDGLVSRQTASGAKVILPIWHGVSAGYIEGFSPTLAGLLAVSTERGPANVAMQLHRAIQAGVKPLTPIPAGRAPGLLKTESPGSGRAVAGQRRPLSASAPGARVAYADLAGRLDDLRLPTVMSLAAGLSYSVWLAPEEKHAVMEALAASHGGWSGTRRRVLAYSGLLAILLRPHVMKLDKIVVDPEYQGYEYLCKRLVQGALGGRLGKVARSRIRFERISGSSPARQTAALVFRGQLEPDEIVAAADLLAKVRESRGC